MDALLQWRYRLSILVVIIGFSVYPVLSHAAATITIINLDDPGEGFNDPAPFIPVGGNTATTLGQARLNAFQYAANIWGSLLSSTVPILVDAHMNPLNGDATSATLGGTSPMTAHMNFPGALRPNTLYVAALANKLSGADLNPAPSLVASDSDMDAVFNSDVDGDTVLGTSRWYYGLDGNSPTKDIDFVSTVLHEIGHGLGFLTLVDQPNGQKAKGYDDAFMVFLENHGATPHADYPSMTNAERVIASTAGLNLHWTGPYVVAAKGGHVEMYAPSPAKLGSSVSHFSTTLTPNELMEPFATGPSHNIGLAAQLLADIGWGTIAPELLLDLNATSFTTDNTLTLRATVNQGVPNSLVDVYAAKLMPDGALMFLQPDGTFNTTIAPVAPNWNVTNNFSGPVLTSKFTGVEPPGSYTWYIAFTTPDTLNITALGSAPYSFTPP